MNVYCIYLPHVIFYRETEVDPQEDGPAHAIVAAETPGQARSLIFSEYSVDYRSSRGCATRKLASNVDYELGSLESLACGPQDLELQSLFIHSDCLREGLSDIEEWELWEQYLSFYNEELPELKEA